MKRRDYILSLFLFFVTISYSQSEINHTIFGNISDENNKAVANVNIFLVKSKRFTTTNSDGSFSIRITENDEILRVSHIGYKAFKLDISPSNTPIHITLETDTIELQDVTITNLSAVQLLNKAINKVSDNYPQTEFLSKMFYRAKIYASPDSVIYVEETAFNQIKSYKKDFNDKTFLERNRNFNFNEDSKIGIRGLGLFDYVKIYQQDRKANNKNDYTYAPSTTFDGRSVFVIEINKDSEKTDITQGRIYIDAEDLAFLKFDLIKNERHHIAQYKKVGDWYYFVGGSTSNKNRRNNGGYDEVSSQVTLTEVLTTFQPKDVKGIYVRNEELMRAYATQDNDSTFWKNYNTILPDSATQQQITQYIIASKSKETSTKNTEQEEVERLYTPNITFRVSSAIPNDVNVLARNAGSLNTLINYQATKYIKNSYVSLLGSMFVNSFLLMPLEQAETERKLLYINKLRSKAKLTAFNPLETTFHFGLTSERINLFRSQNYTDFMRLHTLLEEYSYLKAKNIEEQLIKVDMSNRNNKLNYFSYFLADFIYNRILGVNFISKTDVRYKSDITTENAPLIIDRHKSWVKYLFEPNALYSKHVTMAHLSLIEQQYLKRSSYLSYLNLISPQIFGMGKISLTDNLKFTFSLGYLRTPFGEQTEQNIWFKYPNQTHGVFVRQFINHEKTGFGVGHKLYDFQLSKSLILTSTLDYWFQPENLRFYDKKLQSGFHVGQNLEWKLMPNQYTKQNKMSLYFGFDYKTKGYMPETFYTDRSCKVNLGLKINFN